jgi:hypothetical protein
MENAAGFPYVVTRDPGNRVGTADRFAFRERGGVPCLFEVMHNRLPSSLYYGG